MEIWYIDWTKKSRSVPFISPWPVKRSKLLCAVQQQQRSILHRIYICVWWETVCRAPRARAIYYILLDACEGVFDRIGARGTLIFHCQEWTCELVATEKLSNQASVLELFYVTCFSLSTQHFLLAQRTRPKTLRSAGGAYYRATVAHIHAGNAPAKVSIREDGDEILRIAAHIFVT